MMNNYNFYMGEDFEFIDQRDGLKELFFDNSPFTGMLTSEFEKIPYVNGFAQGTSLRYYPCGTQKGEYFYDQGLLVHIKEWDERGSLIIDASLTIERKGNHQQLSNIA